jgi:Tol biopolymer transport system component
VYEAPLGFENSDFVWRIDLSGPGGAVIRRRQILGSTGYNGGTEPSPDNSQIVFESNRSGRVEVWKADSYGNDPVQLTASGRHAGSPRWSPDGQWIAFDSRTGGHSQIWIMDKEGRNAHAVVTGNDENVVPAWSADGKSIFFASNRTGQYQVWIHNLTTGLERQITTKAGFAAVPSFRGDALFYTKFDGAGIWTVPLTGGVESRLTVAPHLGYWGHFAVAQDGLYFLDTEAEIRPVIEYYDLKSRKITRVTTLGEGFSAVPWAANLAASRDARTLYVAQGTTRNSVMMAEFDR